MEGCKEERKRRKKREKVEAEYRGMLEVKTKGRKFAEDCGPQNKQVLVINQNKGGLEVLLSQTAYNPAIV